MVCILCVGHLTCEQHLPTQEQPVLLVMGQYWSQLLRVALIGLGWILCDKIGLKHLVQGLSHRIEGVPVRAAGS